MTSALFYFFVHLKILQLYTLIKMNATKIFIDRLIEASSEQVWEIYNSPQHIMQWNYASEDWHCPSATNYLEVGEKFVYRMESKDGAYGFDYSGKYLEIEKNKRILMELDDQRLVEVLFKENEIGTLVCIQFDSVIGQDIELQRSGWGAILDNFKKYVERVIGKA